jgi:hypothetical protein
MSVLSQIRAGEIQAKKEQSAKRKAAKSAGRTKTRSAGRTAAARGGIGIVCKTLKHRKSIRKTLNYVMQKDKNPQIVSTNCADEHDAFRTMLFTSKLKPSIENSVGHVVVGLPAQVGKGEQRWSEIIDRLREEIGLTDDFAFVAVHHSDGDNSHVHLVYSRISISGAVHNSDNLGYRLASAAEKIEKEFSLKLFPRLEVPNKLSKNEIEMSVRKKTLVPRMEIAKALEVALKDKPNLRDFVQRMQSAGITVKANVATTGKMSGLSFMYQGIPFKASAVGKQYGWAALLERLNDHEQQNFDIEYAKTLDGNPSAASHASAEIGEIAGAFATVATPTADIRTNRADPAPLADRAGQLPGETTTAANRRADAPPAATRKPAAPAVAVAAPAEPARLITPPDLRAERWARSAQLLAEFRRGLKTKIDIADLDRLATEAGHDPADIISAHATSLDKLPSEVANDVLKNAPSKELKEYIEREFTSSKKRFEAQQKQEKLHAANSPTPTPAP